MITYLLGWLWNFNHVHKWTFKEKRIIDSKLSIVTRTWEILVYECKECGKIKSLN